jgi:hypothetical protein
MLRVADVRAAAGSRTCVPPIPVVITRGRRGARPRIVSCPSSVQPDAQTPHLYTKSRAGLKGAIFGQEFPSFFVQRSRHEDSDRPGGARSTPRRRAH